MRYTHRAELPPSQWIETPEQVQNVADALESYDGIYGFDIESDGLGYQIDLMRGGGKVEQGHAGDGLGAKIEVICLAFGNQRMGVDVGDPVCLEIIARAIHKTQGRACGYNWIFDANIFEYNTQWRYPLRTLWADGLSLWRLWDEDGAQTYGRRDLKSRAGEHLGLRMSEFSTLILAVGGVRQALEDPTYRARTQNYCSLDAWAHLGMVAHGKTLAQQLVWCMQCPECGEPAFKSTPEKIVWICTRCGPVQGGPLLTMWDWHQRLDVPFLCVLKDMQQRGLPIDKHALQDPLPLVDLAMSHKLTQFRTEITEALSARAGEPWTFEGKINPASTTQLQQFYFEDKDQHGRVRGLALSSAGQTKTGRSATNEEALRKLLAQQGAPGVLALLDYRELEKIRGTYLYGLPARVWEQTQRVHPKLRPDTTTGRLTCQNPNGQNLVSGATTFSIPPTKIPPAKDAQELADLWGVSLQEAQEHLQDPAYRESAQSLVIRDGICAPDGEMFVGADYDQLEVRITAGLSGCEALQAVILSGQDMHSVTASKAYAAQIPGLSYELVAEAKTWKDVRFKAGTDLRVIQIKAAAGRLANLHRLCGGPDASAQVLGPRCANMDTTKQAQYVAQVRGHAQALRDALSAQGMLGVLEALQDTQGFDPTRVEALLAHSPSEDLSQILLLLGVRDKELCALRQAAKNAIFGIIYGIGALGLAMQITKATGARVTPEETKPLIAAIKFEVYPGVGAMIERLHNTVETYGYTRTMLGRYRHPAGIHSGNKGDVARAKRQAGNSPIQGTAADLMQGVMIRLHKDPRWNDLGAKLVLQIHDELLALAPEDTAQQALGVLTDMMENGHGLITPVPLTASGGVGKRWGEIK